MDDAIGALIMLVASGATQLAPVTLTSDATVVAFTYYRSFYAVRGYAGQCGVMPIEQDDVGGHVLRLGPDVKAPLAKLDIALAPRTRSVLSWCRVNDAVLAVAHEDIWR